MWTSPSGSGSVSTSRRDGASGSVNMGSAGWKDRPRSGRPRIFGSEVVAGIKALACEPPEDRGVPLSRWSSFDLAAQAVTEGLVEAISSSTVRRWLHADVIKPWRYRSWIFPRDPEFASKAARVLDLYARVLGRRPARRR